MTRSSSYASNPHHLNKNLIVEEEEEKPFEVVSLIADEESREVQDKLAKDNETYQAMYHKFAEKLDELTKLVELQQDLAQELMSIYKNSSV